MTRAILLRQDRRDCSILHIVLPGSPIITSLSLFNDLLHRFLVMQRVIVCHGYCERQSDKRDKLDKLRLAENIERNFIKVYWTYSTVFAHNDNPQPFDDEDALQRAHPYSARVLHCSPTCHRRMSGTAHGPPSSESQPSSHLLKGT